MQDVLGDARWPDDFWKPSTPEAEGLDPALLEAAVRRIEDGGWAVHSFLVVRHGRLVLERYGTDGGRQLGPDDPHELFSTAKSVIGSLVGIAIAEGRLGGVGERVLGRFRADEVQDRSPAKERMTIEDLLTMRSGLAPPTWSPEESAGFSRERCAAAWWLSRPMAAAPGTTFVYSNGDSQALAEILRRATGVEPGAWARERIFGPLGIGAVRWGADAGGTTLGGTGLSLRPRDLARFGWMLLSGGTWKGREVVPAAWVAASTTARVDPGDGGSSVYGYQCWVSGVGGFATRGYMGQFVYAFPDRGLMAVFTGGMPPPPEADAMVDRLVAECVLPAVR